MWCGDNYPQEYPDPNEENGPTDDVLDLREQAAALAARVEELESKVSACRYWRRALRRMTADHD